MTTARRRLDYLPRVLSKWGHCSRKEAERLVVAGRVTVNGQVRRHVLDEVDPRSDQIAIDGQPLARAAFLYLKLHKPLGVVTTMKDPQGRPTVADLIPAQWRGAMPVGRLDQDSTGLLLLTNDHALGNRISGADSHVKKLYRVLVAGAADDAALAPIRAGIELDRGEKCRPAQVKIVARGPNSTELAFVLDEGKFRQIRRSLAQVGLEVLALHRLRIGALELRDLAPGGVAPLTDAEIAALRKA